VKISTGFLDLEGPPGPRDRPVATIGNFDGAHLGHQAIFAKVRERAAATRAPSLAITFDPHPLKVLRPSAAPRMILTRLQKIEIIQAAGFDHLVFIPFSAEIAGVEAEAFFGDFLVGRLGLRELYTGVDFHFGRGRRGDVEMLRRLGADRDIVVESVDVVTKGGERISASRIREALSRGRVEEARDLMGRPYEAIGEVVHGAGRGRGQGSPTANIEALNEMLPASGVYITEARLHDGTATNAAPVRGLEPGHSLPGLTNIGTRPTFEEAGFAFETWMPDFSGDLYGRKLRVTFHARVREERKFPSAEALREQIGRDHEAMREWFRRRGEGA